MGKQEFLEQLTNALAGFPAAERERTLSYYTELIADAVEDGTPEEEAVAALEDVEVIAARIIDETPMHRFVSEGVKRRSGVTLALLIAGAPLWFPILLAAVLIVLAVYLSIWAIAVGFFAAAIGLLAGGLGGILMCPFLWGKNVATAILTIGAGLICVGVGIFLFLFSCWFAKKLVQLFLASIRGMKNRFVRKGAAQ